MFSQTREKLLSLISKKDVNSTQNNQVIVVSESDKKLILAIQARFKQLQSNESGIEAIVEALDLTIEQFAMTNDLAQKGFLEEFEILYKTIIANLDAIQEKLMEAQETLFTADEGIAELSNDIEVKQALVVQQKVVHKQIKDQLVALADFRNKTNEEYKALSKLCKEMRTAKNVVMPIVGTAAGAVFGFIVAGPFGAAAGAALGGGAGLVNGQKGQWGNAVNMDNKKAKKLARLGLKQALPIAVAKTGIEELLKLGEFLDKALSDDVAPQVNAPVDAMQLEDRKVTIEEVFEDEHSMKASAKKPVVEEIDDEGARPTFN